MAKRINRVISDLPPNIDLFILEFAVNDYQGQDHDLMVVDRKDVFFEGFRDIALCTEAVLFKLLKHYPDTAVVFLEMRTGVIPRKTGALLHMGAAQHYQVPVISYEQTIWPGYLSLVETLRPYQYTAPSSDNNNNNDSAAIRLPSYPHGCHPCNLDDMIDFFKPHGCLNLCDLNRRVEEWALFNCTHIPEGREACYVPFLAHDVVHPSGIGHTIATDLIIDAIASTAMDLCRVDSRDGDGGHHQWQPREEPLLEQREILPSVGWMVGDSRILDATTDFIAVADTYTMFYTMNKGGPKLVPSTHTTGFDLLEDKFDRRGWIATNEAGNESITFEIHNLSQEEQPTSSSNNDDCYIPYLSVLKSYEKMGQMVVTIDDKTNNKRRAVEIDSLWDTKISVPYDTQLIAPGDPLREHGKGCSWNSTVTVTTKPMVEGRAGNKVKIITLSVRPCIPREFLT